MRRFVYFQCSQEKGRKKERESVYIANDPRGYLCKACLRKSNSLSCIWRILSESLKDRILDRIIRQKTADEGLRGGKTIPLKNNVDEVITECPNVHTVLVIKRMEQILLVMLNMTLYTKKFQRFPMNASQAWMLKILYLFSILTKSGSQKGFSTTGGYLLQAAVSHKLVFDYKDEEIYWCTV